MSRRGFRDLGSYATILVLVALVALLAWLSRSPDSPVLESAQDWPLVGPLARGFRQHYLPPAPRRPREAAGADFFEWDAPVRGRDSDRDGLRWLQNYTPFSGDGPPPLGSSALPPEPLPGREADEVRLAEALLHLQQSSAAGLRLGPYALFTDVVDVALLDTLSELAERVEPYYRDRFGVETVGSALETIVLYRHEDDYRALQRRWGRIRGIDSQGHTGYGLVALFVGALRPNDLSHSLLHELAHLLNRRALGPALPPWLGEGLADDIGAARPDATGGLEPGDLRESRVEHEERIELRGPLAGLGLLARSQREGTLGPLSALVELDWETFVVGRGADVHYAHAAFFVRFLFSEDSALAAPFRLFLADVAAGGGVEAAALEKRLGRSLDEMEAAWRRYLVGQIIEAGLGSELTAASARPSARRGR